MWNRVKLVPFEVSFEGREDKTLKATLLGELPGTLAWAAEGCIEWQRREGLNFPESVVSATYAYRQESDHVARFIEDCCVVGDSVQAKARPLYTAYRKWAEEAGEGVLSETAFGTRVGERFKKDHKATGWVYERIGLRVGDGDLGASNDGF